MRFDKYLLLPFAATTALAVPAAQRKYGDLGEFERRDLISGVVNTLLGGASPSSVTTSKATSSTAAAAAVSVGAAVSVSASTW